MDVQKISVKIFAASDSFAPDPFLPIFHRWIQSQSVEGHRLIDVADYGHVAAGPGTVLVSSEANFYMDRGDNRLGFLYSRKLPLPGSFGQRLRAIVAETFKAAVKLEQEPRLDGKLKFKTDELLIRLNDRLLAPPGDITVKAVGTDILSLAKLLYGEKPVTIDPKFSAETLVEFRLKASEAPPLATLLGEIDSGR
ncbi:MAG TPA: hypothetical protein VHX86_12605 [Tepidisphaeraceae bacterium]|jgi:hypothetical protein|nr:hypothetical protein [Tepidisphaeraceae bacterium]